MSISTQLLLQLSLALQPAAAPTPALAPASAPAPEATAPVAAAPAPVAAATAPAATAPASVAMAPAPAPAAAAPPPPVLVVDRVEIRANTAVIHTPAPIVTQPPPIPPQRPHARRGVGLMITSGVFGTIAWGATIAQLQNVDGCRDAIRSGQLTNNPYQCAMRQGDTLLQPTGTKVVANLATWGLAPAAGAVRGNYNAIDSTWGTKRTHRPAFWIGTGLAFTVAGALGSASSFVYLGRPCRNGDCTNELRSYFVAQQLSQSAFAAGLGLLTYGIVYGREYRRQEDAVRRARVSSIRMGPQLTAGGGGAALVGRF